MADLAQIKKQLGPDGDRLQAIFVTVDPQRDTPQVLKAYMASFDPSFVALRGRTPAFPGAMSMPPLRRALAVRMMHRPGHTGRRRRG